MEDLVSVIVPAYNCSMTVERCINSIINQTYKKIEILIINDGSTDNTLEILKKYNNPKIKIITIENKGVSNARNVGIDNSTGKYIMFVDSDDYISEELVKKLVRARNESKTLSVCDYQTFFRSNEQIKKNKVLNKSTLYELRNDFYELFVEKNALKTPWGKIYDANIIKENNINFDTGISLGEDLIFNLKYIRFINHICYIYDKLYYYSRENNLSLSCKYYPNMVYIQKKIKDNIIDYINYIECEKKDEIYITVLKMLMSAVSNEFNKKNNIVKKYFDARKIFNCPEIQEYIDFLYENRMINKITLWILKNRMIFIYSIIKKRL